MTIWSLKEAFVYEKKKRLYVPQKILMLPRPCWTVTVSLVIVVTVRQWLHFGCHNVFTVTTFALPQPGLCHTLPAVTIWSLLQLSYYHNLPAVTIWSVLQVSFFFAAFLVSQRNNCRVLGTVTIWTLRQDGTRPRNGQKKRMNQASYNLKIIPSIL